MLANASEMIEVEIVRAWARRFVSTTLRLPAGATVAEALAAEVLAAEVHAEPQDAPTAVAVFGERVEFGHVLADGDRIEVLRPLLADPKDARRRRAKR
jgi:uncharacterized protein